VRLTACGTHGRRPPVMPPRHHHLICMLRALIAVAYILPILSVTSAQANISGATGLFEQPYSWDSKTVAGSPVPGWDPINVVIVRAPSTQLTSDELLTALQTRTPWHAVSVGTGVGGAIFHNRCISEQDAAVDPGDSRFSPPSFNYIQNTTGASLRQDR